MKKFNNIFLLYFFMSRTFIHRRGDTLKIKKNHAGAKRVPRKEWMEGKLNNRFFRRYFALEEIKSY